MRIVRHFSRKARVAFPLLQKPWSHLTPQQFFAAQSSFANLCWLDCGEAAGWSYFGINPRRSIQLATFEKLPSGVLREVAASSAEQEHDSDAPPFCGGWVGFLSFDNDGNLHSLPALKLNFFDLILAYSFSQARWWVGMVSLDGTASAELAPELAYKVPAFLEQFATVPNEAFSDPAIEARRATSNYTRRSYCAAVRRALNYIEAGDIYQLNLAQRFTVPWSGDDSSSASLYRRLRQQSPAACGAFIGSGLVDRRHAVCCISPELFLSVQGRAVVTRPIKGTRPRSSSPAENAAAARELANSAKERAELNMIIDVERHDLGRVCEYGSVRVDSPGDVEELPTLYHRVATVSGRLRPRCSPAALVRAAFPGGSISGAPKIRAMQIIRELEAAPRGLYCGSIGWLGVNGDMQLNIAIRTAVHDTVGGSVQYHAGSGIVADSDPEQEYEETLHKSQAFFRATNAKLEQE